MEISVKERQGKKKRRTTKTEIKKNINKTKKGKRIKEFEKKKTKLRCD